MDLVYSDFKQFLGDPGAPAAELDLFIYCRDHRLYAKVPFRFKDLFKFLPGARWVAGVEKAWAFPATYGAARNILSVSSRIEDFGCNGYADDRAYALLNPGSVLADIYALRSATDLPDVPFTRFSAWNHQRQAYWFAQALPAVMLNMDMATGKTKVVIDLILNRGYKRVLVLGPTNVISDTWPRELAKHSPAGVEIFSVQVARGRTKDGAAKNIPVKVKKARSEELLRRAEVSGAPAVVLSNYEGAWREPYSDWLLAQKWDLVVADEIHRIKAPGGAASKFVAELGALVPHRLGLTGTIMPHSPLDVFGQYRFLDPALFGYAYSTFKKRYAIMGGYQGYEVVDFQNKEDLYSRIMSCTYQVGSGVLDLPPVQHIEHMFSLEPEAAAIYKKMERDFYVGVSAGEVTAANALTKLLRLQQIVSGHITLDSGVIQRVSSAKLELLEELLSGMPPKEPVVIFCRFREDIRSIRELCESLTIRDEKGKILVDRTAGELSGARSDLSDWLAGKYSILVAQIQSGGVGIDLTRARYCIYYSLGFSLGDYEQSLARVNRPGQDRPVVYLHLIGAGTVDVKVYRSLREKKQVVENILSKPVDWC